jgi:prenyltransferase beta subunit
MRRLIFLALLVPAPLFAQSGEQQAAAITFLSGLQQPDGGFIAAPTTTGTSSLRATSGAVRAIVYLGGEIPNRDKVLAFVKSCHVPESGAFADTPGGKAELAATSIGLMAMSILQADFPVDRSVKYLGENARTFEERRLAVAGMEAADRFAPQVKDWLAEIEKNRNADGTYGKDAGLARETGGVWAMVLRSGGTISAEHRKVIIAALQGQQRPDGGFGKADTGASDAETTYRVMRAFYLLKARPKDVPKLREFLAKHRNADGGSGTAPGQPSSVSGTYYAAMVGSWLGK